MSVQTQAAQVTGAEALIAAAAAAGVEVCFANPGTTEMPIVSALDAVPGVRAVLGLHENVCTGAADGYARIAGRPALTLLHLGPGLANGLANLHNARRANSPVVNVVGDHTSWHLAADAPLTSDIVGLARTVGTVLSAHGRQTLPDEIVSAIEAATQASGVSTLVVPADHQLAVAAQHDSRGARAQARPQVPAERIDAVAKMLGSSPGQAVVLLGSTGLSRRAQDAAGRISAATGATLYSETFPARAERGGGLPAIDRLPYFPEAAIRALEGRHVVLAGTPAPVAYFGYEGIPSRLAPEDRVHLLSAADEDSEQALVDLASALEADGVGLPDPAAPELPDPGERLDGAIVGQTLAALLPEDAIVSVEGGTCGYPFFTTSAGAAAHTALTNTGGAIGQGLPVALGAAIAAPERRVIALQSDGSALYTPQALWTMARERCDVVVLIAANNVYNVLRTELGRHGNDDRGTQAEALTSLGDPCLDWRALAEGFGVPATRAATAGELADQLTEALLTRGPRLIEMVMDA